MGEIDNYFKEGKIKRKIIQDGSANEKTQSSIFILKQIMSKIKYR